VHRPTRASGGGAEGFERIEVRESLSGLTDPRPDRQSTQSASIEQQSTQSASIEQQRTQSASIEQQSITVSRVAARALCALSRRFSGCFASPAPLGVHRPTRASGDGAEGVERIEGARRRR
jgi:hypothetical protein